MRKWLALFLFGVIILMVVFPVLAIAMEPEYLEYETIVLSTLSNPSDPVIPNWRELYLRKIERYEKVLTERLSVWEEINWDCIPEWEQRKFFRSARKYPWTFDVEKELRKLILKYQKYEK